MKLYIINDVLYDYTPGMVVIAANDLYECRKIYEEKFRYMEEFDRAILNNDYKVLDVSNVSSGVISYVYGGG